MSVRRVESTSNKNTFRVITSTPLPNTFCVECWSVKTIGERIKQARLARGMSGEDLARAVGYSHQSAISNLEARATGTGGRSLGRIASVLGVQEAWLRYGPDSEVTPFVSGASSATPTSDDVVVQYAARTAAREREESPIQTALRTLGHAIKAMRPQRRPELAKALDLYITDPALYGSLLLSIEAILSGEPPPPGTALEKTM